MSWRPWLLLASAGCRSWVAGPAEGAASAGIDARITAAAAEVATARGRPLSPPAFREVSPEGMRDVARADYAAVPEPIRAWALRQGRALGVYGDTDPLEGILAEAVIGGMWHHDEQQMILLEGLPAEQATLALRHELTHALQDRHFDLARAELERWPTDARKAHTLLGEGEASYVPLILAFGAEVADWAPLADLGVAEPRIGGPVERRYLAGAWRPYVQGPAVIQALRREGGWAAVDARWARPALSTEQLLEPDRSGDLPRYVALDVAGAVPAGWTADAADTLGQQEMYDILWAHLPGRDDEVAEAVRGWDGDRLQVLVSGDAPAGFVWRTAWDTAADAEEFAVLVTPWRPVGRTPTVEIRGDEVLVTCADRDVPALRDAAWEGAFFEVGSMAALLAAHAAR